ncbi:MAG: hypothetical protein KKG47_16420 [Proteobacteria bacterium]|nr:hypothetical protein [Pseudomonadota bacterium]MBU1739672.1 hypothetical protein [Pseudomonadota bacterium]
MKARKSLLTLSLLSCSVFMAANSEALVTSLIDPNIDLSFSNPGARANAMGGAFIGVADDATAAYTNPAGLTILTQTEASVEVKSAEITTRIRQEDQTILELNNSTDGVSFLSYAKPSGKSTFALFRHEFINIELDKFTFVSPAILGELAGTTYETKLNIRGATYGAGLGVKLHDKFSIGGSIGFSQLNYHYSVDRKYLDITNSRNEVSDSAMDEQYSLSLLANPFGDLNVGLVYRVGPELNTAFTYYGRRLENTLKVPDMYGIGISYRFFNSLTLAVDANRIKYSDLLENYYYFDPNKVINAEWTLNTGDFEANDTTEVHAGFEYVFSIGETPFALRGGYFHKPDHAIHYVGTSIAYYQDTMKEGEDDDIFSVGIGGVLSENLQFDIAGSSGDFVEEINISFVYRFQ